jgi:hypothetical protein
MRISPPVTQLDKWAATIATASNRAAEKAGFSLGLGFALRVQLLRLAPFPAPFAGIVSANAIYRGL